MKHLGKDVMLVDSDRQNSTTSLVQYRIEREEELLNIHSVKVAENMSQAMKDFKAKYAYIIIYGAGGDSVRRTANRYVSF